jgi:hypothetical protein
MRASEGRAAVRRSPGRGGRFWSKATVAECLVNRRWIGYPSTVIRWLVLTSLYVAAGLAWVIDGNSDWGTTSPVPLVGLAIASFLLGWSTGSGWAILVPLVLFPLALPFGEPNKFSGGDDLHALTSLAIFPALASMFVVALAVAARRLVSPVSPAPGAATPGDLRRTARPR